MLLINHFYPITETNTYFYSSKAFSLLKKKLNIFWQIQVNFFLFIIK